MVFNVTKFALFFTYILITEATWPKGVRKCSEEGTWESLFYSIIKGSGLLSSRLLLDWLRVDRKSGIFPFFIPIGFRWSKLPLFVRKERINVECAAICLYLHLAKSVHSSPFVIKFLLDVLPPTPNWFIDSGFLARSYQLEDSDSCSIPRHHSLSTDDFPALKIILLCRTLQKG